MTSGHRPFRPFSNETLEVMKIDNVLENSNSRVLYVDKSAGNSAHATYHVEVPGKVNSCIAQVTLPASSADDAKKIALTLSKAP